MGKIFGMERNHPIHPNNLTNPSSDVSLRRPHLHCGVRRCGGTVFLQTFVAVTHSASSGQALQVTVAKQRIWVIRRDPFDKLRAGIKSHGYEVVRIVSSASRVAFSESPQLWLANENKLTITN
jgi:hypothetical protein